MEPNFEAPLQKILGCLDAIDGKLDARIFSLDARVGTTVEKTIKQQKLPY